jgi:hypothetical protein
MFGFWKRHGNEGMYIAHAAEDQGIQDRKGL